MSDTKVPRIAEYVACPACSGSGELTPHRGFTKRVHPIRCQRCGGSGRLSVGADAPERHAESDALIQRLRGALGMYPGGKAADPDEAFEQCLEEIRRFKKLIAELEAKRA